MTFIMLYFVFSNTDFKEIFKQFKNINYKYIAILVCSIITSLSLRGLCFKQLIYKSVNLPVIESALLCITSSFLNIALPARAGDVFRAYFVGDKYKVSKMKVFGAVMLERVFDMIDIGLLLLFAISVYNRNALAVKLCFVAFSVFISCLIFIILTYKYNNVDRICNLLKKFLNKIHCSKFSDEIVGFINKICNSFCCGFEIIDFPKKIFFIFLTSMCIWILEFFNYICIIWAFNLSVHWSVSIFISCFIVFACLIPSTSIFVGPYQIAVIAAFSLYNVSKESALAVTVAEQVVVILTTGIISLLFLLKNNISFLKLKNDIK